MELIKLTEEKIKEIRKSPEDVAWPSICFFYELPEDFMREFSEYLDWDCVSNKQVLSEQFIDDFYKEVSWSYIKKKNYNFSDKFKKRYKAVL